MAEMLPPENVGVYANGRFYRHTPHFFQKRAMPYPIGHSEATDARIIQALENPEYTEHIGNRHIYWSRIHEPESPPWWLKIIVVENAGGPAILSAYQPRERM